MRRVGIMWRYFFYYFLIIVVATSILAILISQKIKQHYINPDELINIINQRIFYWAFILIIFGVLLTLIFSKKLAKSINEIIHFIKKIGEGDFTSRVLAKSEKDELGKLVDEFNRMTEKLQKLFSGLTTEKEELTMILSLMVEGVVVLDSEGKIILANDGFKNICAVSENVINKHYWEVIRNFDFTRLIDEVHSKVKEEGAVTLVYPESYIHIRDKIYLGKGALVYKNKKPKTVVVLYDITQIKQLEQMKSEFIANVSHELRTPLTAIKGFVETMEENEKGEQKHFLEIIKKHTDRMIKLVSDLLILSTIETKERKLEMEDIDLRTLLYDVINIFKDKAEKKGLKIEVSIPDNFPLIKGDSFFIEQAFINLLDNAIKYTEEGKIRIELFEKDSQINIGFYDTGIGIPKAHLSRIFDKFYTVDKARSRKLGGTGLGLSIVKNIVLAHNGKIDVESEPGKGSKFIISLPKR